MTDISHSNFLILFLVLCKKQILVVCVGMGNDRWYVSEFLWQNIMLSGNLGDCSEYSGLDERRQDPIAPDWFRNLFQFVTFVITMNTQFLAPSGAQGVTMPMCVYLSRVFFRKYSSIGWRNRPVYFWGKWIQVWCVCVKPSILESRSVSLILVSQDFPQKWTLHGQHCCFEALDLSR